MKTLPSIDITDGQYARLAAVLPGDTAEEKGSYYVEAVKQMLRQRVIEAEIRAASEQADLERDAAIDAAYNNPDNL